MENLVVCPHVIKPSPKHNGHFLGPYPQSRPGAIQGGISDPQNNHVPLQFEYFLLALGQLHILTHIRQKGFGTKHIRKHVCLLSQLGLWGSESRPHKNILVSIFFEGLLCYLFPKGFIIKHFDPELFDHLDFPENILVVRSICWNLVSDKPSRIVILLKNMNIIVTKSSQEGSTRERSRPGPNERNFGVSYFGIEGLEVGVSDLFDFHLFENFACELL